MADVEVMPDPAHRVRQVLEQQAPPSSLLWLGQTALLAAHAHEDLLRFLVAVRAPYWCIALAYGRRVVRQCNLGWLSLCATDVGQ